VDKVKQGLPKAWKISTDGAVRSEQGASGLAAIARDEHDQICYWWKKRAGRMTNNEAEYAAVIFALEQMLKIRGRDKIPGLIIYSDSQIVVEQMSGRAATNAPALRVCQARLRLLVKRFANVSFRHISREQNRLADALAFEAVEGLPRESQPRAATPNLDLWEQFNSSWRTNEH